MDDNQKRYLEKQEIFDKYKDIKKENLNINKDAVEKELFDVSTKISKCNFVANNLMRGLSWDDIEIKLDGWEDRKFTSKEKLTRKVKENREMKEIETEKKKEIDSEEIEKELSNKTQSQERNGELQYKGELKKETFLMKSSALIRRFPRIAKIIQTIENK